MKKVKEFLNFKKVYLIIAIILIIITLIFTSISFGKYKTTIDVATINITVTPMLAEYNITGTNKILAQHHFTSGSATIEDTGASYFNKPFEITSDGLYINDTSTSYNCWCMYWFIEDDGYTSALNTSHIYYARSEVKLTSLDSGYLCFAFSNAKHNVETNNGVNGMQTNIAKVKEVTDTHQVVSLWSFPLMSTDNSKYTADYMDAVQIGSANSSVVTGYLKNFMLLDLTEIFGEGNEPPQEWCDANIGYNTTTITWFAEKEQSRINSIPESYYPYSTSASTLSLRNFSITTGEDSLDSEFITNVEEKEENNIKNEINNITNDITDNTSINTNSLVQDTTNDNTLKNESINNNAVYENTITNTTEENSSESLGNITNNTNTNTNTIVENQQSTNTTTKSENLNNDESQNLNKLTNETTNPNIDENTNSDISNNEEIDSNLEENVF